MSNRERRKGADGEREVVALLRAAGLPVDRTARQGGISVRGDLAGIPGVHVEVKRQEQARPWAWWEQAQADAPAGTIPVVAFRRSRSEWLALLPLDALARLLAERK